MPLKRIKGSFTVTGDSGRRWVFKAGSLVDDSHPMLSNAHKKKYLEDISSDYPLPDAPETRRSRGVEQATATPGEVRDVRFQVQDFPDTPPHERNTKRGVDDPTLVPSDGKGVPQGGPSTDEDVQLQVQAFPDLDPPERGTTPAVEDPVVLPSDGGGVPTKIGEPDTDKPDTDKPDAVKAAQSGEDRPGRTPGRPRPTAGLSGPTSSGGSVRR